MRTRSVLLLGLLATGVAGAGWVQARGGGPPAGVGPSAGHGASAMGRSGLSSPTGPGWRAVDIGSARSLHDMRRLEAQERRARPDARRLAAAERAEAASSQAAVHANASANFGQSVSVRARTQGSVDSATRRAFGPSVAASAQLQGRGDAGVEPRAQGPIRSFFGRVTSAIARTLGKDPVARQDFGAQTSARAQANADLRRAQRDADDDEPR